MRDNLKKYRERIGLTQDQMAQKMHVNRATYAGIENGSRDGRMDFWQKLQKWLNIPDAEMWALMQDYPSDKERREMMLLKNPM